jgi:hypothetical protein
MRQGKRRSAAITLVLAGSLSGCGEPSPQRDVYTSLADCRRDWSQQGEACEPVRDGRFSNTWFYGPAYYGGAWPGGGPRPSANAVDAVRTGERPGVSSGISRGGFGSSARSVGG